MHYNVHCFLATFQKKNLTDVFNMAQLPARVWVLFASINKKYEQCGLKDQTPSRKDVLTTMKMKTVHFRTLSALTNPEREMLLRKVNKKRFNSTTRPNNPFVS